MENPIKSIDITAPRNKPDNTNNNKRVIAYASSVDNYDYSYTAEQVSAPYRYNQGNTLLRIEGSFTVNDDYFPVEYDDHSVPLPINLYYEKICLANYNRSYGEMYRYFVIDKDNPKKVNFKLNEDWNYRLDLPKNHTQKTITVPCTLSCTFLYKIKDASDNIIWTYLKILSTSELPPDTSYNHSDGAMVYIPKIWVEWVWEWDS